MKSRTPFHRFLTVSALIMSILALAVLVSCAGNKKKPVVPPTRIAGKMIIDYSTSIEERMTDAVENADAVACVRIGDWLGDTDDRYSIFEFETIELIRGELTEGAVLLQDGTSTGTIDGFPLFTAGNELLLFLEKCSDITRSQLDLPADSYFIAGAPYTVSDIVTLESGERFIIPRDSKFASGVLPGVSKSFAADLKLRESCLDELKRADEIWNDIPRSINYVYYLDKLIAAMKESG